MMEKIKKIKSNFFLSKLFQHLDIKKQLLLIIHNKSLQKRLNMSINNYKIFNGTYTIYESDSKGKIFDAYNHMLKYEGEFLNGKRNGKGKEYHDYYGETLKLKFEGEYLKGKRNGKGKEYDENGTLIFEGEYLNGLKHGKGIEYDYLGWIMFEGDFLNGEINKGIGKTYYLNGAIGTITEYLNGKVWSKKEYDRFGDLLSEIQEGKGSRKIYNNEDELKSEIELYRWSKHWKNEGL